MIEKYILINNNIPDYYQQAYLNLKPAKYLPILIMETKFKIL